MVVYEHKPTNVMLAAVAGVDNSRWETLCKQSLDGARKPKLSFWMIFLFFFPHPFVVQILDEQENLSV